MSCVNGKTTARFYQHKKLPVLHWTSTTLPLILHSWVWTLQNVRFIWMWAFFLLWAVGAEEEEERYMRYRKQKQNHFFLAVFYSFKWNYIQLRFHQENQFLDKNMKVFFFFSEESFDDKFIYLFGSLLHSLAFFLSFDFFHRHICFLFLSSIYSGIE